jgi:hypothetical protein
VVIVRIVVDIVVAGTVKVVVIVVFTCVGSFGVDIIVVVVRFCPFDVVSVKPSLTDVHVGRELRRRHHF